MRRCQKPWVTIVLTLTLAVCVGDRCLAVSVILTDPSQIVRTSEVTTVVTDNGNGTWTYNYTVINTSPGPQMLLVDDEFIVNIWPLIVDYEVPLDGPGVVSNVQSPDTWDYEFISAAEYISRFGEANPFDSAYVMHWYDAEFNEPEPSRAIAPNGYTAWVETEWGFTPDVYEPSTDGFIFTSARSPVNGPYLTSWVDEFRNIGDPPLPGGSVGGGGTPTFTPLGAVIPEPLTMMGVFLGIGGLGGYIRRRRLTA